MSKLELEKRPEDPFYSKILLDRYIAIIRQISKLEVFDITDFNPIATFQISADQSQSLIQHRSQIVLQAASGVFTLAILSPMTNEVIFNNGKESRSVATAAFQQAIAVKALDEHLLIFARGTIRFVKIDFVQFGLRPISLNELGSISILDIAYDRASLTFAVLCRDKLQVILAKEEQLSLVKQEILAGDSAANLWYSGIQEYQDRGNQRCLLVTDVNKNIYFCQSNKSTDGNDSHFALRSLPGVSNEARLISPGLLITRHDQTAKVYIYDESHDSFRLITTRTIPRKFVLIVLEGKPNLLIWDSTEASIFLTKLEINFSESTAIKPVSQQLEQPLERNESTIAVERKRLKSTDHFAVETIDGQFKNLIVPNPENYYQVMLDCLRLNEFGYLQILAKQHVGKMPAKVQGIISVILVLAENLGYAKFDFQKQFIELDELNVDIDTICSEVYLAYISQISQIPPVTTQNSLIGTGFVNYEKVEGTVSKALLRDRNALLFDFLQKETLQNFMKSTIETENYRFFESCGHLVKQYMGVFEIFETCENFHVVLTRETLAQLPQYLPSIISNILTSILQATFHRAKFTLDNISHDFINFNIVKLYNTVYYLTSKLIDLASFCTENGNINQSLLTDKALLLTFLSSLITAERYVDVFDLLYYKQEYLDIPGFESVLMRIAELTKSVREISVLEPFITKVDKARLLGYKLNVIKKLLRNKKFLMNEHVTDFHEYLRCKTNEKIANNYYNVIKGYRDQLLSQKYLELESKLALASQIINPDEYKARTHSLKFQIKDEVRNDDSMIEIVMNVSKALLSLNKVSEFSVIVNSMFDTGLKKPVSSLLTALLRENQLPFEVFAVLEKTPKLPSFLSQHLGQASKKSSNRERLAIFLVQNSNDYTSLIHLSKLIAHERKIRSAEFFDKRKEFITVEEPDLGIHSPMKLEKLKVENVLSSKVTADNAAVRKYKIVAQYSLVHAERGFSVFEKMFDLKNIQNLEGNVNHFVNILKIISELRTANSSIVPSLLNGFLSFCDTNFKEVTSPKVQTLQLVLDLCATRKPNFNLLESIYDVKSLNSLLADSTFAEALKSRPLIVHDVLTKFIQNNADIITEPLANLKVLDFLGPSFFERLFDQISMNFQLSNLIVIKCFVFGRSSQQDLLAKLLCSIPTFQLRVKELLTFDSENLLMNIIKIEGILRARSDLDQMVRVTLEYITATINQQNEIDAAVG